ncbi:polysaccharide biosynthesis/export family protein [Belnapia sp. T6]|uniref:Polysaccharide biosynthesis/export family protein n=1 Tax=Belnapia mucosa TaxID=2804532 RepID=A0ABS1V4R9_9PROT|nr:polysaccharide biosynthesis/export family protein [Belnapia mucosa]MBL6456669.1 polysaccharide biosynthesis/export family protein [Belnapia mucosa]
MFEHRSAAWPRIGRRLAALLAAAWLALPVAAGASPALRSGDVIEIAVAGVPALTRRATVGPDGRIAYPVLGMVDTAELSPPQLQALLQEMLAARNVVQRPVVSVDVIEYRPISVGGDVARPGEYRFQPGMTVRNAVALAGGYDLSRIEGRATPVQLLEARSDYGAAGIELVRQEARAARLRAQLAGTEQLDPSRLRDLPVDPIVRADILGAEEQQLQADLAAQHRERAYLERLVEALREQHAALVNAEAESAVALSRQSQSINRARELLDRSVGTMARLDDAQRGETQSRAQLFDTRARLAEVGRQIEEATQRLDAFDNRRRAGLLDGLKDAVAEAGKARFRLDSARDRMGAGGGSLLRQSGVAALAVIHRRVRGVPQRIEATADTELLSGDALEIADATPDRLAAGLPRRTP